MGREGGWVDGSDGAARGRGRRCERRAGQVEGGRELEALGSTGPLYNSKTIESAASVTYPRVRGRGIVAEVSRMEKKRVSSRLERGKAKRSARECSTSRMRATAVKVVHYRIEIGTSPVGPLD